MTQEIEIPRDLRERFAAGQVVRLDVSPLAAVTDPGRTH